MAIVGNALASPESGWRRIQDDNENIVREGDGWTIYNDSAASGGKYWYTRNPSIHKIKFYFTGTRIRLIDVTTNTRGDVEVKIDGVSEIYSSYQSSATAVYQRLVYEKIGLANKLHYVEIKCVTGTMLSIDAIDIDSDAEIRMPYNKILISSDNNLYSIRQSETNSISKMTSNTSTTGVASASSEYNSTYAAWKAFNHVKNSQDDRWGSADNIRNGWLKYDFGVGHEKTINRYSVQTTGMTPIASLQQSPKDWTFEASNDGFDWIILDKQISHTNWQPFELRNFKFHNTKTFRYYRINITENNGAPIVTLGQLEMFEPQSVTLINAEELDESIYIKYGMNNHEKILFHEKYNFVTFSATTSENIQSGKVFKQKIDASKTPIKKVSIE